MKKHSILQATTLGMIGFLSLTGAHAVPVITEQEGDFLYTPDSSYPSFWTNNFSTTNNVLYGLTPSSATGGNFGEEGSGGLGVITDGIAPITGLSVFATVGGTGGAQVIFDLAAPTQLSAIQYYGGWVDQGRSDALFDVSYSTDNGLTWNLLLDPTGGTYSIAGDPSRQDQPVNEAPGNIPGTTFSKWIGAGAPNDPVSNFISIIDDAGNLGDNALITNLKFDFYGGRNGYNGLVELAAYSAVPEPGTSVLCLSAALLGLWTFRRRGARPA